jgi:hypothetical protein
MYVCVYECTYVWLGKNAFAPVFNKTPRHEDFEDLLTFNCMAVSGQLSAFTLPYTLGRCPSYPLDRKWGVPQFFIFTVVKRKRN